MRKQSPDIVKVINFNSPSGRYNQLYLSNFVFTRVRDEMLRVEGVGDVFLIGQRDYSMRIWLDPDKLSARGLTTDDVVGAIREQNTEVACGYIGQEPALPGQQTQIKLSTLGRLSKPEEFGEIVIRVTPDGRIMRLKDVARLELGAKNVDVSCMLDGKPSAGLAIFQLPDANALDLDDRITAKMKELEPTFPEGVTWETQYDSTPYTRQCINEVIYSLIDAIVLVAFVVLLFLQNWRSALIPLVAVPVAILGTFAVMLAMGFTLNNLTLFGLVLAIGIVVDDAIVVVEAVEHHIEHGMSPREATIKAMSQVSGTGNRRGAGLERGVRALCVHQRPDGPVLPAVRADDRRLDDHLLLQLAHAQPGAGGPVPASSRPRDARAAAAVRVLACKPGRAGWLAGYLGSRILSRVARRAG